MVLNVCGLQRAEFKKLLIVVKLTTIFILLACLTASATGFSQKITLSVKNEPLTRVLTIIEKQSGISFIYGKGLIEKASKISMEVREQPLSYVLELLFKNQPLEYKLSDKYVVISSKEKITPNPYTGEIQSETPPPITIKGRVINEKGDPVVATITIKGSKTATTTDNQGFFELRGVDGNAVIVISGVGVESKEIKIDGQTDLPTVVVKIKTTVMDELQVIAYGVTSKRFNVGTVTTVTYKDIEKQPVNNVLLALQGRVAGLTISPTSGAPGAAVKMQVRGQNTLQSQTNAAIPFDQPLVIIDGVPFAPQNNNINIVPSAGGGYGYAAGYQGFGPLNSINPADIESVSVLRDADATSIYGSQGANGVIIIITKKGQAGKTNFNMNVNTGPNTITRTRKFLNTQQYLQMRYEGLRNDGITLPPVYDGNYPDLQLFDTTKYTNWVDKFYGQTSNNTDVHASISGGSGNTTFIFSAGYNHSTYNFPGDFAEDRMSIHSGFHYNSNNNKLTIDFGTDFSYNHNNNTATPDATSINILPPNTPDLLDASGNLVWMYKGFSLGGAAVGTNYLHYQQYAYLKFPYSLKKYDLNNSLQLTYKLFTGLSAMLNLGYSRFTTSETAQFPISASDPAIPNMMGTSVFAGNEYETINIEPQLNYQLTIGKGIFTALVGATYKRNGNQNQSVTGTDYINDGFLGSLNGAGRLVDAKSNNVIYKYIGVYGRARYVYDNKYILNLTGRRDGSTNFGLGRQYGNFASVGAGWIVSEETFFKGLRKVVSFARLSANYGTNGSDGVEPYNYQAFWSSPEFLNTPFQGLRPYLPVNLYNPDYSWALKKSLNVSLDLSLLDDRLVVTAAWFKNKTSNQLVSGILPYQTGFASVIGNLAATVQNTGWEFGLQSTIIKNQHFNWISNLNFSRTRNKLLRFPDLENSAYLFLYTIGESTSAVKGFSYKGVNPATGVFEFIDGKGNATYTPSYELVENGGDVHNIADLQPGWNGGWDNTFTYKGLSLSLFFQFAQQTAPNYLFGVYNSPGGPPGFANNVPELVLNRWQKPGDISPIQRFTADASSPAYSTTGFFLSSSGVYGDASYIRLKTVSLAYSFPSAFIKKAGMDNLRAYVNAQNLFLITGYEFGDPELPGQLTNIPLQRTIACGLSFNF